MTEIKNQAAAEEHGEGEQKHDETAEGELASGKRICADPPDERLVRPCGPGRPVDLDPPL